MSETIKVVINTCYGGFGLSDEGFEHYLNLSGVEFDKVEDGHYSLYFRKGYADNWHHHLYDQRLDRTDPNLVRTVEELGEEANGLHAVLKIVEVPDDVNWEIEEYDGTEWVREVSRSWS